MRSPAAPSFARRAPGFGLLEMTLTFILVLVAGAIVFSLFGSGQSRSGTNLTMDQVQTVAGNVRSSFFVQPSQRALLTNDLAQQAHLVTRELSVNFWGGAIGVLTVPGTSTFQVLITQVPVGQCAPLVMGLGKSPYRIVGRASTNDLTTPISETVLRDVSFQTDPNAVITACHGLEGGTALLDIGVTFDYNLTP
jgi:hypothetical protein